MMVSIYGDYKIGEKNVNIDDFEELKSGVTLYFSKMGNDDALTKYLDSAVDDYLKHADWRKITDNNDDERILETVLAQFKVGESNVSLDNIYEDVRKRISEKLADEKVDGGVVLESIKKQFISAHEDELKYEAEELLDEYGSDYEDVIAYFNYNDYNDRVDISGRRDAGLFDIGEYNPESKKWSWYF